MTPPAMKKRQLYREEIEEILKNAILTNQLKPGDRIVETRWARELGVSQSPVREAIRELEVIGLIENIPYRGAFVKRSRVKDLRDSYLVRNSLEQLGIQEIVNIISDEQLTRMQEELQSMESAADNGNFDEYIQNDVLFHESFMELSENALLLRLWSQSNVREWTQIGTISSKESLQTLGRRHEAIYEALASHDLTAALNACNAHFISLINGLDQAELTKSENGKNKNRKKK